MNGTLYRAFLWRFRKTIVGYSVGSSLYLLSLILIFPSMKEAITAKIDMLQKMPEGFLKAFGMAKGQQITTLSELLNVQYFSLTILVIGILFAFSLAARPLANMQEQGSLAYLLATPLSRTTVYWTMVAVWTTSLAILVGCNALMSYIGSLMTGEELAKELWTIHLLAYCLFYCIGSYALFFSVYFAEERKAAGWAGSLTLLFYLADLAGKLSGDFESVRYVSLFYLYEPSAWLVEKGTPFESALVYVALSAIVLVAGQFVFQRKNLSL